MCTFVLSQMYCFVPVNEINQWPVAPQLSLAIPVKYERDIQEIVSVLIILTTSWKDKGAEEFQNQVAKCLHILNWRHILLETRVISASVQLKFILFLMFPCLYRTYTLGYCLCHTQLSKYGNIMNMHQCLDGWKDGWMKNGWTDPVKSLDWWMDGWMATGMPP